MGSNFHETFRTIVISIAVSACFILTISTMNSCSQEADKKNQESMALCINKGKSWVKVGDSSYNCI